MKAVRIHEYGGPGVLVYEEVDKPSPGPGQLVVRLAAASVNQVDVAVRENRFPTPKDPPKILGSDGSGVVVEVGPDATVFVPGDEVVFNGLGIGSAGSYAEYVLVAETQAVRKPVGLPFAEAAAMGLVFPTAYYGLVHKARLQAGETVLIQGAAGGVGSAAVQLARAFGARVIATVGNEEAVTTARGLGADIIVDYHTDDVAEAARSFTGGVGVDVVIETQVSANLAIDIAAIAKGGRIVGIGGGPDPQAVLPTGAAIAKDAALLFMSVNNAGRAGVATMLEKVLLLAAEGKVNAVIGATFPLSEAQAAHEALAGDRPGKIVLVP